MPGFFLDLRNHTQVLDFIAAQLAYLPEIERGKVQETLDQVEAGERLSPEELADLARKVGRKSWPARQAVKDFLKSNKGCDEEWRMTVAAVTDSTAHLLERFRHGTKCKSLDAVLTHEDADTAFHDRERTEIAEVRKHVEEVIWRDQHKHLASQLKKQEALLKEITTRFDILRELGADAPWIQDQIYPKLSRFEDDMYFAGHALNPKELDEEIKLYREEKELPAE